MFRSHFLLAIVLVAAKSGCCHAFSPPAFGSSSMSKTEGPSGKSPTTELSGEGGLFGQVGNPLQDLFGNKEAGPKVMVDIPAKEVKTGALRFLLQIHLVAEQNNPAPQTWLMKDGGEGELDVYFNDGTGMFAIDMTEYQIKMTRYGEKPSLQYQIQESVLMHSVLDELHKTAFEVADEGIEEEKRLLRLNDPNAIESARSNLLARSE